ncbi:unnamed protein product [Phytophthora lilii]|uniref:Unnamed protein product n=1 Tax=Phytophthora lilii TaxID=2077276 RepID=A0A9W6WUK1_9STRA|nr:unnamed protein product [Phytophthora lilii]
MTAQNYSGSSKGVVALSSHWRRRAAAPLHVHLDPTSSFVSLPALPSTAKETAKPDAIPQRKMKVSASRRERCRINQARYRKRQRQHAEDLKDAIQKLNEEILDLEDQQQSILRSAPTDQSVWVVATEYFRHFHKGYMKSMAPTSQDKENNAVVPRSHAQLEFLRYVMVSDVTDGILCGPQALLENWRLMSLYYSDVNVKLKRLLQVEGNSVLLIPRSALP